MNGLNANEIMFNLLEREESIAFFSDFNAAKIEWLRDDERFGLAVLLFVFGS